MINIHSNLLNLIPTIGPEGFTTLCVIANRIGRKKNCWPSKFTLKQETGLGRRALDKALRTLKEAGLIQIVQRRKKGSQKFETNSYKVTTQFIQVYVNINGEECEDDQENEELEEQTRYTGNGTTASGATAGRTTASEPISIDKIEVLPSTSSQKEKRADEKILKFEPDEELTIPTIQISCRNMTKDDIAVELLRFKLYFQDNPPKNIPMRFIKWCQEENSNYANRKLREQRTLEADKLAKERMESYHNDKLDKMNQKKNSIQKEVNYQHNLAGEGKGVENKKLIDIWQDSWETVEEFEARVQERMEETGSYYRKHYWRGEKTDKPELEGKDPLELLQKARELAKRKQPNF